MQKRRILARLKRALSSALSLALAGDIAELARRLRRSITHTWPPLPANLRPAMRPSIKQAVAGDLLIMASPSLDRSGAPLSQFELARGLALRGWPLLTIAVGEGPLLAAYREAGLALEIWPSLRPSAAVPSRYERDVQHLAGDLLRRSPALVYANTLDLFPAIDAARIAGLASIWNIREGEPWQNRLADRHPKIAARALAAFAYPHAVVPVAQATDLAWSNFIPTGRSRVIYNAPSNPAAVVRRTTGCDELRIASIGTLCPRKGQLDLVQALPHLPSDLRSRLRITFVGRDENGYAAKLRAQLPKRNSPAVKFTGDIDDVEPILRGCDLLVHCARAEAFPRVFLEAAAAGAAIISSRAGGAEERLRDEHSALLYEAGNTRELARSVMRLAENDALRQELSAAARRDLVDAWSHSDMLDAYERLINEALAGAEPEG